MTVKIGKRVKDFDLPATGGKNLNLSSFRGKKVVLYFYPKDNTPGCTRESTDFAALSSKFSRAGAAILGVSRDSVASHERFKEKLGLPFALLSDMEERLCRQFGVMQEKIMFGRKSLGIQRSTFLIDREGVLRREWRKAKVPGHAEEVLQAVRKL